MGQAIGPVLPYGVGVALSPGPIIAVVVMFAVFTVLATLGVRFSGRALLLHGRPSTEILGQMHD